MSNHSDYIHPAKSEAVGAKSIRRSKDEDESCYHKRGTEVPDTVGKPGKKIESSVLVGGEDIAEVGAIKDVFKCREDFNPYRRAIFAGDESTQVSNRTGIGFRRRTSLSRTR